MAHTHSLSLLAARGKVLGPHHTHAHTQLNRRWYDGRSNARMVWHPPHPHVQ